MLAEKKKSTVIVSQTWDEIRKINERIRIGLRSAGLIDKADSTVMRWKGSLWNESACGLKDTKGLAKTKEQLKKLT